MRTITIGQSRGSDDATDGVYQTLPPHYTHDTTQTSCGVLYTVHAPVGITTIGRWQLINILHSALTLN